MKLRINCKTIVENKCFFPLQFMLQFRETRHNINSIKCWNHKQMCYLTCRKLDERMLDLITGKQINFFF